MRTTEEQRKNILIAQFMGLKVVNDGISHLIESDSNNKYGSLKALHQYENSWNLLMPVIEKIESLDNFIIHSTFFNKREVCIKAEYERNFKTINIVFNNPSEKLNATYTAVIEFINWYNKNK